MRFLWLFYILKNYETRAINYRETGVTQKQKSYSQMLMSIPITVNISFSWDLSTQVSNSFLLCLGTLGDQ